MDLLYVEMIVDLHSSMVQVHIEHCMLNEENHFDWVRNNGVSDWKRQQYFQLGKQLQHRNHFQNIQVDLDSNHLDNVHKKERRGGGSLSTKRP